MKKYYKDKQKQEILNRIKKCELKFLLDYEDKDFLLEVYEELGADKYTGKIELEDYIGFYTGHIYAKLHQYEEIHKR